jgi:hypothetical protein
MICLLLVVMLLREGVGMYYIFYLFVNLWNSLHMQTPFLMVKYFSTIILFMIMDLHIIIQKCTRP